MIKKKILFVFGTRPEAIKLAPVIKAFLVSDQYEIITCSTGQHMKLMDGVFNVFGVPIDFNLEALNPGDDLSTLYSRIIYRLQDLLKKINPDLIFVHGDTISTLAAATCGFLLKIPIGHIEAGLRTYDKTQPWPEEINRSIVGILADFHFPPTKISYENLKSLKIQNLFLVGNTIIDSVKYVNNLIHSSPLELNKYYNKFDFINFEEKIILVTLHRRENYGDGFKNVCLAIKELALKGNTQFVFPVHFNPNVKNVVDDILKDISNVYLIEPLEYLDFIFLMSQSFAIITDSGGIQEEATFFKLPILICRNTTERPEVVEAGIAKLVGTDKDLIINEITKLLEDQKYYQNIQSIAPPFGIGDSSDKILEVIKSVL